jgi:NAD(P)-dependent dehydrogenase (short-subunit alcohol dehydrogenase family)
MNMLLMGKTILVTGATRGIGLAVAKAAQAHGAQVLIADIDDEALELARQSFPQARMLRMDVADEASIEAALGEVEQLDGLVNNAAILDESNSTAVEGSRLTHVMEVNALSIVKVAKACLPLLCKSPDASIVNTLSTQSFFGQANSVAYAAAKGAALNLTRCMAIDYAPLHIRVNGVAPGFIDTRMAVMSSGAHEHETDWFKDIYIGARKIPMARAGTPDDCAGAYLFLLSPLSHYITGQVITVDGGLTATY